MAKLAKKNSVLLLSLSGVIYLGSAPIQAQPPTVAAAAAMLYGPAKDLGNLLIEKYFDRREELMTQEAEDQALKDCDRMYVKFWQRVEDKKMDLETTKRYGDFFQKYCIELWER
jgi:hypothetical protein